MTKGSFNFFFLNSVEFVLPLRLLNVTSTFLWREVN